MRNEGVVQEESAGVGSNPTKGGMGSIKKYLYMTIIGFILQE